MFGTVDPEKEARRQEMLSVGHELQREFDDKYKALILFTACASGYAVVAMRQMTKELRRIKVS